MHTVVHELPDRMKPQIQGGIFRGGEKEKMPYKDRFVCLITSKGVFFSDKERLEEGKRRKTQIGHTQGQLGEPKGRKDEKGVK